MKKVLIVLALVAVAYILYTIKQTGKKAGEVVREVLEGINPLSSENIANRAVNGIADSVSGEEGYLTEFWFRTFNSEAYRQEQEALENINR